MRSFIIIICLTLPVKAVAQSLHVRDADTIVVDCD